MATNRYQHLSKRPKANRGAYVQGSMSHGGKKEKDEIETMKKLEWWTNQVKKNEPR